MSKFAKATKTRSRLRLALIGPAGSGKTYTALTLAKALGAKVAVIDTERGSASKYADLFDFDVLELESFNPTTYTEAIREAGAAGYDFLIVDSLSHAWIGKEGSLEQHDKAVDRQKTKNSFTAWREVTPDHNTMVDSILQSPCHVIATMRAKTEYIQEKDDKGKTTVRKVGLAPVQRDGLEYEFDVVADMDGDNTLVVSKTRCSALAGGVFRKPGKEVSDLLRGWLSVGKEPAPTPKPVAVPVSPVIEDEQREELSKLLAETHTDPTKFPAWLTRNRVNFLDELTLEEYKRGKRSLLRKLEQQKKELANSASS